MLSKFDKVKNIKMSMENKGLTVQLK